MLNPVNLHSLIMKRLSSLILATTVALAPAAFGTQSTWVNNGTITTAPNIDATNVVNNGSMSFLANLYYPYDFSNVRNFTNNGTMEALTGFRFDYSPENSSGQSIGARRLAANFHNRVGGQIQVWDGPLLSGNSGSYLLVQATNIVNQGLLSSTVGSLIQLVGSNVNISRSGLGDATLVPLGYGSANGTTNFSPDAAVYDRYWGQTNDTYDTSTLFQTLGGRTTAISPVHEVTDGAATGGVQVRVQNAFAGAFTNVGNGITYSITNDAGAVTNVFYPTNITRQAVFVSVYDPTNITVGIRFTPSPILTNPMQTVTVRLAMPQTNVITGSQIINELYIADTLASRTNRGTLLNTVDGTRKPANYLVSRVQVPSWNAGGPTNAILTNGLFWDRTFGNPVVSGEYAGYMCELDNLTYRPPAIPAGSVTNLPGRVEVYANSLDMSRTRIGTAGLVKITTEHLITSSNAIVDCENLSYDLASTNGNLHVQDLIKPNVDVMRGYVQMWSGYWTNMITQVITNYDTSTNPAVYAPITNYVNVGMHALMVNASPLANAASVFVHSLKMKGTNVYFHDNGTVVSEFIINGQSFTLTGDLSLDATLPNWSYTNAPGLRYFTNTGSLFVQNEMHAGDDGPVSYLAYVNRGLVSSYSQAIESDYVELAGTNAASGGLTVSAVDVRVENGSVAAEDIAFAANTLKLNHAMVNSSTRLYLDVAAALFDNGETSGNVLNCSDGFVLGRKPATGDLLGTTLQSLAPNWASVTHWWAAADRGNTNTGYKDNVAVGRLTLAGGVDPEFIFQGVAPAGNALYVDELDLSQLTDYANQVQIASGFAIYYAALKLPPGVTPPGGQTAEEFMDNQYGGRLHWVRTFAGPNSSVDVVINGNQTIKVNRALRLSKLIDSDSDGVPNYFDLSPFDGVVTTLQVLTAPPGYRLSWTAAPQTVYRVETRSSPTAPWTVLTETVNSGAAPAPWSVVDTNLSTGGQRFYRVSYNPNGR